MKRMQALLILLVALISVLPTATAAHGDPRGPKITVMTRNLYVGFDVAAATEAIAVAILSGHPEFIPPIVKDIVDAVAATNSTERAQAIAEEIARTEPEFVGLQEVSLFRSQDPSDFDPTHPIQNATTVDLDFLQELLDALAARHQHYDVVAVVQNADVELPAIRANGTCCRDIRLTDHDVVLARRGVVKVLRAQTGNFTAHLSLPGLGIPVLRGWAAVDARVHGRMVRVVNTHLEPVPPSVPAVEFVQVAQAQELLAGPATTPLPLIMLGDFNSRADGTGTATYGILLGAGFEDAWAGVHPGDPGFTCCQDPDLLNPISALSERIDLVLTRGDFAALDAEIVGEKPDDRTEAGLWPSDHAGVAATLRLPRR